MCFCFYFQVQGEMDGEVEWYNVVLDFIYVMSYGDYLKLDKVLDVQFLFLFDYNEMLFIIQYQILELWMKLMFYELWVVWEYVKLGKFGLVLKMFVRVLWIFD